MTNQNNDEQLRKALEEGNLISVGQKSISIEEEEKEMVPIESKINQTFFKYNLPIGIDFEKSLKPNKYLTTLEILDRTLQISIISEDIRFKLENLRLFLTTGKIWHYKKELKSFLNKVEEDNKDVSHKENSEKHLISLLTSLYLILNQASTVQVKWVSQNQILKYIDSENKKKMMREWKTKKYGKLPEDAIFLSLISQTLIHQILSLNLPLDEKNHKDDLNDLKILAISAKFSKIKQITADNLDKLDKLDKLKKITSNYLPSINSTDDLIIDENTSQMQSDFNKVILFRILDTLNILQNE